MQGQVLQNGSRRLLYAIPMPLSQTIGREQMSAPKSNQSLQPALHRWLLILNDLPDGSVVLDHFNNAWQQSRRYWYRAYGDSSEVSSWELAHRGPGRTIWRPDE